MRELVVGTNKLNADRFFDPNPVVRRIAREIYGCIKDLPIISPHGHVDPSILQRINRFQIQLNFF